MKIRCSCGAKYEFDVTPEMAREPVKFICPNCGLDSSDLVNELIRAEIAEQFPDATSPPPTPAVSRLKISREEKVIAPPETESVANTCLKHGGALATEKCAVCGKPICPKCLEQFGFFCSPFCRSKAESQNKKAPVYAGQKFAVEARFWRKAGIIFGSLATILVLAVGFWIWYAWFGSVPHTYFSLRFADDDRAYAGGTRLVGPDQIVFLHGGTLARYDLKTKKPVWSQELVTKEQVAAIVQMENEQRARENESDEFSSVPPPGSLERKAKIALQRTLSLHVSGQNIWVAAPGKLTHYDWDSGKILQEIPVPEFGDEIVERGDELLLAGAQSVIHVNLASGQTRAENFSESGAANVATANRENSAGALAAASANGQPTDAQKLAAQAQNLNLPGRLALPALLGNVSYEQKIEAALKDDNSRPPPSPSANSFARAAENPVLIPDENGFVQFSTRLVQKNIVAHEAMRAPPQKSVLNDPNLNVSQTTEAENETLNEMQRNNGGDKVLEDESVYQVTLHRPDASGIPDWTGQVVGPPQLFVLKTVNVLAAGKTVIVFDKSNKKLWETALTYPISNLNPQVGENKSQFGEGPCVEHGGTLFVFDEAVLSAFDLASGNARWRLPTIGVVGLFFDGENNLYVNTTTGNPDDIKYSRQIDISKNTDDLLLKIDAQTGKILWRATPGGFISYVSGNFIYAVLSYDPNPTDQEVLNDTLQGLQRPPYLRLTRLNPKNGRAIWQYDQARAPVAVRFKKNFIELVFKKEVLVLKYLSL
ncbi:MAG TPA: PQQ-binding-like beta-propeller repeat protein [Verrucomicrobiae bacterium]